MGVEDWLPTLLELTGTGRDTPKGNDGISLARRLLGRQSRDRPFLYRETPAYGGQQCVRVGDWKLVRKNLNAGPQDPHPQVTELYHLAKDPRETADLAGQYQDIVDKLLAVAKSQRTRSSLWPIIGLDSASE